MLAGMPVVADVPAEEGFEPSDRFFHMVEEADDEFALKYFFGYGQFSCTEVDDFCVHFAC